MSEREMRSGVARETIPDLRLLTVPEAAAVLRISRSLMYQLVETGRIAACRLGHGRGAIRIRLDDLLDYVESRRTEGGEGAVPPGRLERVKLKHLKIPG